MTVPIPVKTELATDNVSVRRETTTMFRIIIAALLVLHVANRRESVGF